MSILALLGLSAIWWRSAGIDLELACYGALHAISVAVCLRSRPARPRALAFTAGSAMICVTAAHLGLYVFRLADRFPMIAPFFALSISALSGAFGYGLLLRRLLDYRLALGCLVVASLICMLAALAAFTVGGVALGGLWVAGAWWLAFSGTLWYQHRRNGTVRC